MSSAFLPLWWRLLKSEVWCELHSSNCELWRHCWCCRRHPRCLGRRRRLVRGGDGGAKVGGDDGEAVRVNTSHRGCQSRSQSSSPLPHFFSFLFFHGLFAAFLQAQLWGPTPPKTAGCWRSNTRWWCHPLGRRWYYEVGVLRLWGCWQPRKTDARGSLYLLLLLKARRGCSAENFHIYIWRAAKVYFKYQGLLFWSTLILAKTSSHLISK